VRRALAPAVAAALALGGCGYGFSQRYVAKGGEARVHVRAFENLSTEPELGVAVTGALRSALARRGAEAGEGAPVAIEGEVRAGEPVPTSTRSVTVTDRSGAAVTDAAGAPLKQPAIGTWSVALEVRARLVRGRQNVAEHVWRREATYLAGADALETEGRRALALRRLADEAAPEILRAFEE
jgi:hypothetical protein